MPCHPPHVRTLSSTSLVAAPLLLAGLASGPLGCASDGTRTSVSSSARRGVAERTSDGLELAKIVPSTTSKQSHDCKDGIYALTGRG